MRLCGMWLSCAVVGMWHSGHGLRYWNTWPLASGTVCGGDEAWMEEVHHGVEGLRVHRLTVCPVLFLFLRFVDSDVISQLPAPVVWDCHLSTITASPSGTRKQIKPFFHKLLLIMVFYHRSNKVANTTLLSKVTSFSRMSGLSTTFQQSMRINWLVLVPISFGVMDQNRHCQLFK